MNQKINWSLFQSIITDYREKKITRDRFIYEWNNAQRAMARLWGSA